MASHTHNKELQLAERQGTPFTHIMEQPSLTPQNTLCRRYKSPCFLPVKKAGITVPGLPPSLCPLCQLVQASLPMVFESIHHFYSNRQERRTSPEAGYGAHWHDPSSIRGQYGNTFRVAYIQATGELYTCRNTRHGDTGLLIVLGVHAPDVPTEPEGIYYSSLDTLLTGWPDTSHTPQGLQWLKDKLTPPPTFQ